MSNPYIDLHLVECNRLSGTVLGEDTNNSKWVNDLPDTLILNPGDTVSMYSSFISERGSGQAGSLEFKGKKIGTKHKLEYTNINSSTVYNASFFRYNTTEVNASNITEEVVQQDNKVSIVASFYKTMDMLSYIQLPRRFQVSNIRSGTNDDWVQYDSIAKGMVHGHRGGDFNNDFLHYYGNVIEDIQGLTGADKTNLTHLILKNDNTKYTIFIRENTKYIFNASENSCEFLEGSGKVYDKNNPVNPYYLPPYNSRSPENASYVRLKQKIDLEMPIGFTSAQYTSDELTRQLNLTTDIATETQWHKWKAAGSHQEVPITKEIKSSIYKTVDVSSGYYFKDTNYNATLSESNISHKAGDAPGQRAYYMINDQSTIDYYRSYQYIALKRPEIYEKGILCNSYRGEIIDTKDPGDPDPVDDIDYTRATSKNIPLPLSIAYTKENCLKLKNFVESQKLYPELFSAENIQRLLPPADNIYFDSTTNTPLININNSRWIHMNLFNASKSSNYFLDDDFASGEYLESNLGNSYYDIRGADTIGGTANRTLTERVMSAPFFFHYDEKQKDTFYEYPTSSPTFGEFVNPPDQLTFGFIGVQKTRLVIYPNKLAELNGSGLGMPNEFFSQTGYIETGRNIGFDRHWNAWGTCAIVLNSGVPTKSFGAATNEGNRYELQEPADITNPTGFTEYDQTPDQNKIYIGADDAKIGFDGSRFFFSQLHTPLNQGFFEDFVRDDSSNAPNQVYKLNPSQAFNNYTPTQYPYGYPNAYTIGSGADELTITRNPLNPNMTPYAIYDTTTGIFFEDLGYGSEFWEDGLWNILGFTYDQLVGGSNNIRNDRVDEVNVQNLKYPITTNANVDTTDTKGWNQNVAGSAKFDGSVVNGFTLYTTHGGNHRNTFTPEIIQNTTSIKIQAQEYPVAADKAYYTIRSDIVPTTSFIGGQSTDSVMPVVGLVDRMNPQSDYFFGTESSLLFTITKPTILSSVSVSIHDPDGTYASTSKKNSIVFKIQRQRTLSLNIAQQIKEDIEKKQKKSSKTNQS